MSIEKNTITERFEKAEATLAYAQRLAVDTARSAIEACENREQEIVVLAELADLGLGMLADTQAHLCEAVMRARTVSTMHKGAWIERADALSDRLSDWETNGLNIPADWLAGYVQDPEGCGPPAKAAEYMIEQFTDTASVEPSVNRAQRVIDTVHKTMAVLGIAFPVRHDFLDAVLCDLCKDRLAELEAIAPIGRRTIDSLMKAKSAGVDPAIVVALFHDFAKIAIKCSEGKDGAGHARAWLAVAEKDPKAADTDEWDKGTADRPVAEMVLSYFVTAQVCPREHMKELECRAVSVIEMIATGLGPEAVKRCAEAVDARLKGTGRPGKKRVRTTKRTTRTGRATATA